MFGKAFVALALAATAIAQLQVSSPASLIVCQPALLSWSGGTAPYYLSVIPGGQASAAALVDLGQQTGTSYTWNVNITAGTSVTLKVVDNTGAINYASPVTIQEGSSTSCLTSGSSSGASASSGAASGAASASVAASGAASSAAAPASSAAATASAARSSAASGAAAATSAAASGASAAASGAASGASAAASAAASATGAASLGAVVNLKTGLLGAVLGAAGLLL